MPEADAPFDWTRNRSVRSPAEGGVAMAARAAGFTLLELLVALVIFGLILTTLTQATHFGLLASRTEARLAVTDSDLNEADLLLRHLIEAADPGSEDENQAP